MNKKEKEIINVIEYSDVEKVLNVLIKKGYLKREIKHITLPLIRQKTFIIKEKLRVEEF